jgi:C4-dicarboxylate transporter DctM subunit
MVITFIVCLAIGVPMLATLGMATLIPMIIESSIPLTMIPQVMYTGVDQFPIIAVTGFILAGLLMADTGITDSIIEFASSIVGNFTGGLANITILSSMFFASLSGSGPATTAAVGSIMYPAMHRQNYTPQFSAGIIAVGGVLGILIPPSNPMIMYAIGIEQYGLGIWQSLDTDMGSNLRWRATLETSLDGEQPSCDEVTLSWLYPTPTLEIVEDVPNDQGRQVRLHWLRSGEDWFGIQNPVTEYAIYRYISDPSAKQGSAEGTQESYWDYVGSVPATMDLYYSAIVPTLADSTADYGIFTSLFKVRALSAQLGYHHDSNALEGYSVDNLSPGVPMNFRIAPGYPEGNELTWDESLDQDFRNFRI